MHYTKPEVDRAGPAYLMRQQAIFGLPGNFKWEGLGITRDDK